MRNPALNKLYLSLGLLLLVYAAGVGGYMALEGWSFQDASFMTVITVATVGFGEVRPLDAEGRWFTTLLILGGMGTILYGVSNLTAFVVEGELRQLLRRTKMLKRIHKLEGHYIVCGNGRVGQVIYDELRKTGRQAVLVFPPPADSVAQAEAEAEGNLLLVYGDATRDEILEAAGVRRAAGLLAALHDDKDNLFVVLTARALNPALRIVARADEESSRDKLQRAGADNVVLTHTIGGMRMVSEMIRPTVVDFLDTMLRAKDTTFRVEEAQVMPSSDLDGLTVEEADLSERVGVVLVALRHPERTFEFNPDRKRRFSPGDVLVVIGEADAARKLRKLAGGE
jgi:voltage-gated potassium channel